ncbi:hypothetical protein RJ640_024098 [Escallonia rubra]|uniref:Cytochrome P450 n=1 Tax=Escallonia rubra TaxID=112253 RepID=A0AA88UGD3_9ASTE|nr:hypothetical protein RJ640_024098 [Escallonia rubra]
MERSWRDLVWFVIILSSAYVLLIGRRRKSGTNRLPPGPRGWPVFGHMFNLGTMPHRTLAGLKQLYGPVVWLKLGSRGTMVILTTKAAAELFKNHDLSFVDRNIIDTMRSHDYNKSSLALAPYGTCWRMLRRICTVEMFVSKRINETVSIRRKGINDMLLWIEKEASATKEGHGIHVARFAFLASFNMLGNLMLSRELVDPESKVGSEFFTAMTGLMQWGGHPNITDLFPCLGWLDLQGLRKKADRDMGKALEIAFGFVRERVKERQDGGDRRKDFLDVLLEFEGSGKDEPAKLSEKDITTFILEIFLAGSETTSSTAEWALTQLLCNPKIMIKVKNELAKVIGPKRRFEESDIDNLPYFHAVVKETLRFHPPVPFLVPRKAIQDTNFMGYNIPKDTQVFVNAWAIGRDPEYWDDPLVFKPERFLGSKTEYKGQHFEFIPFGAGRRMCAGVPLAHRMLHLVLGSLLHEFDWELESHVTAETMDMSDRLGVTVRKSEPLKAIPKKSLIGVLCVNVFDLHGTVSLNDVSSSDHTLIYIYAFLIGRRRRSGSVSNRLPPGPRGWPVFGHMFNLGTMPHRTLAGLKQQYGPVVWLKLGSRDTMVILTTKAAAELFKNHDLSFADRNITDTMRSHDYHNSSLALAPYGTFWRVLRRICTVEMFVSKRINETVSIRRKCVNEMLLWIEKQASATKEGHGIHVARFTFLASFNMLGNLMLSRDLVDPESKVGSEFFAAMTGLMEWGGHPNIADLFPCLGRLDLQGLRKKTDRDLGKALDIALGFVRERVKERQDGGERRKDFLDVLLDFEGSGKDGEPAKLSEKNITSFILEMFLAGSETTSSTVEWALTQLLCNPKIMTKVKDELAKVVGPKRRFEESDVDNLPYFQAVVKETLRFYPPLPFLVPRKTIQDTNFMGYNIPKDTQVFVNAWAIGRDPEYWADPLVFKPERFLGSKTEYKGQHFEFIPFGAGRRMCVGIPLAHRMLHLILGSLLHEFDWELESHVTAETMDMTDRLGIAVRKSEPLKAIPKKSLVL